MLRKRRDLGTMPDGLMKAKEDLVKGMIVARTLKDGSYVIAKPKNETDAEVYGFVTLREDEATYKESHYDNIAAGQRAVVYTLVKDNEWATDQFEDDLESLEVGDKLFANTTGKLKKVTSEEKAIVELIDKQEAMAGYEKAMVVVKVL